MNFLAHAFLSGEEELVLVGNITGDTIRAIHMENFPVTLRKGVILHRAIDEFTDAHPEVLACKKLLSPYFKRYSGVALDVYFDHFLSVNWEKYSEKNRDEFIRSVYQYLQMHNGLLPEKSRLFIQFMIRYDWLRSYHSVSGISAILLQMSGRTKSDTGFQQAREVLEKHYLEIDNHFNNFFPELVNFSRDHNQLTM